MELRVLLLQLLQLQVGLVYVGAIGKEDAVGQNRLQCGHRRVLLCAQTHADGRLGQTHGGHHVTGQRFVHGGEFAAGQNTQLGDFFLPAVAGNRVAGAQGAAGDLQVGQACAALVPGDFKDFRAEFRKCR